MSTLRLLPFLRRAFHQWNSLRLHRHAVAILGSARQLESATADELRQQSNDLRWRAWRGAEPAELVDAALPLVCEAIRRQMGFSPHVEQVMGGLTLVQECVSQMQTGEGKTLTALLPAFVHSLAGQGVHVLTVNDYLAERDAELAQAVLGPLGVSIGRVHPELDAADRRSAYACDVTYGTAKEIGFDFLRDRLRESPQGFPEGGEDADNPSAQKPVQRGRYFALVDEADSLLIDEARTPLLIATRDPSSATDRALVRWCTRTVDLLNFGIDFTLDSGHRSARLTDAGCLNLLRLPRPSMLEGIDVERLYHQIEQSLTARHQFSLDRHYVIAEGKVAIVDESTGRVLDGRRWQQGLHQAIEAKEGLETSDATRTTAKITVQTLFRSYRRLSGLTGTARSAAGEFQSAFRLPVVTIPTHRPCLRKTWPTRVFVTLEAKHIAVAHEVQRLLTQGRAVLVGTPSVAASERLDDTLSQLGIHADVLNCRALRREAEIVAQAGQPGRVTIATNMAGRGTDIRVDPEVLARGGLHVIGTERHSSRRIDDQLVGRTSRQGEPGTCEFLLSLEDELLSHLPRERLEPWTRAARRVANRDGELPKRWHRLFDRVQRRLERDHARQRAELLVYERRQRDLCRETGLDPCLDLLE